MNYYIRDILIITFYGFIMILQLSFSSFLIDKKNNLMDILYNYNNITDCKNDAIYRLRDGALTVISMAIIVSSSVIIGSCILLLINKYILSKKEYISLGDIDNTPFLINQFVNKDKYDTTINIIFIMAIICFIISNGIQFILQLNNISDKCLIYINSRIDNFYVIYKIMTCTSFLASYALFFIIPCFI